MPDLLEPVGPPCSTKDGANSSSEVAASTPNFSDPGLSNGRHAKPDFHLSLSTNGNTADSSTASTAQSPVSSPLISTPGGSPWDSIEFDFDVQDLSVFDLVGSDWVRVLQNNFKQQRRRIEASAVGRNLRSRQLAALQKKVIERQLRVLTGLVDPRKKATSAAAAKNRDKIAFVVGVTNMWVTALLFGVAPSIMPYFYVVKAAVLLLARLVTYKNNKWHYFMFDMCYFVNFLLFVLIFFRGAHTSLYAATWGLANGPVLVAITAWRNSLVFHSLDKVTSLLIHFDPPLTLFTLRWVMSTPISTECLHHPLAALTESSLNTTIAGGLPSSLSVFRLPAHLECLSADPPHLSFMTLFTTSLAVYMFWQAAYWVFVWTMRADKIAAGYATSTTYMLQNHKSAVAKVANKVAPPYRPAVFMGIQFVYTMITIAPTYLFYHYKWLHATALVASLAMATYNGANYYFEVFSKKYVEELLKLEKEIEADAKRAAAGIPSSPNPFTTDSSSSPTKANANGKAQTEVDPTSPLLLPEAYPGASPDTTPLPPPDPLAVKKDI
ncbi:uncharacterized protein EV422DRAFT_305292 [Fimicolochytrium jonesii]|uniref:uncharacterized protein n=1 Tax=Fimicolochytrium jonesii TaxID=1396493 RepID=UPI0022FEF4EB|nr:uncharacterized protein EV422DRAFT_305292 [Fimicolochytrium jonesii]KAI8824056.1 hypothetical protein EV422DRAFT_305292 [Fimicolochytrium jonesii]